MGSIADEAVKSSTTMYIPTLNVLDFSKDIVESFTRIGFVKVVNHEIPNHVVDELFEWSRHFFAMSSEAKTKTSHPPSRNTPQRGWSNVGVESTSHLRSDSKSNRLDAKEHFDQGSSDDMEFPNRWPLETDLPGFHRFMESYYDLIYAFSIQMLSAIEIGLHIAPGSFTERCKPSASDLRLNHYPAITVQQLQTGRTSRIWPHSDFGLITLLLQDDVGGLEIEDRDHPGEFLPVVRNSPYEIVLNVSDTLQRWTNDVLKSGIHRVSVPWGLKHNGDTMILERYSVAFFFKADRTESVGPLSDFMKPGEKLKYDDITALEFQKRKTQTMYLAD